MAFDWWKVSWIKSTRRFPSSEVVDEVLMILAVILGGFGGLNMEEDGGWSHGGWTPEFHSLELLHSETGYQTHGAIHLAPYRNRVILVFRAHGHQATRRPIDVSVRVAERTPYRPRRGESDMAPT